MTRDYDLTHPAVRYRPPPDGAGAAEPHCPATCEHLRQAWMRGYLQGRRDERERREGSIALRVLLGVLGGMLLAAMLRLGGWMIGGR